MLSEINQTEKEKHHILSHMQNLDFKKRLESRGQLFGEGDHKQEGGRLRG
jgi:hypothetical protein